MTQNYKVEPKWPKKAQDILDFDTKGKKDLEILIEFGKAMEKIEKLNLKPAHKYVPFDKTVEECTKAGHPKGFKYLNTYVNVFCHSKHRICPDCGLEKISTDCINFPDLRPTNRQYTL